MSGEEKILRASFCGAANHLTQLYMASLKQEKLAYKRGYCHAIETIIRSLQQLQHDRNSTTISTGVLLELLNNKKREIASSMDDATVEEAGEEEEKAPSVTSPNNQGFSAPPRPQPQFGASIPSPFQQPQPQPIQSSFGRPNPAPVSTQSFTFGAPAPAQQPPIPSFPAITVSNASTFTQAVSNSIPFPSLSIRPPQTGLGLGPRSGNGSRKRQFFEYVFESTPAAQSNNTATDFLSLFGQPQPSQQQNSSTTTTTASATSNDSENGEMDFSSYGAVWKRSRLDEPLVIQNNG